MAGSYRHVVDDQGVLLDSQRHHCENLGDAWETIQEMYGMIWWLAGGDAEDVEAARSDWQTGIALSPSNEARLDEGYAAGDSNPAPAD